ncbi:MAG: DNA recombination protein RmuC [Pseudomonadota bacterium]|jgi:DNA recombination protein RmuC|nr:DNA recombination protein RmuC [Syntrophaceae bacterium]MDI9554171.1 DNA recombination protein RmuC [Pseudomonadota bacterium]NLX31649.1 DNA recombination protein RmuC [Deltaproteobacteria bacterium]HNU84948.1 DNA recombination protein RmuC [Syntrophales bacterium]HNZ34224.1 DNA recombination protein RmuC [Syntrophales bacterium]
MSIDLVIIFAAGFTAGGILLWVIARLAAQKEIFNQVNEIRRSLSARVTELEGRARYAEGQMDQLRRQLDLSEGEIAGLRKALDDERVQAVEAQARLDESARSIERQRGVIETMRTEMADTFRAQASAALESSNRSFLELATENLGRILEQTKGKLGEHQAGLEGTIRPLQETLKRYEEQLREMERVRAEQAGDLSRQIQALGAMNEALQRETAGLSTALRKPQVSGSWGQMSLRRAAELAGMAPWCDFDEQVTVDTEAGKLRPDMIVRLPNGRVIVVDAKAPVDAFLNALQASGEEDRKKAFAGYVAAVRAHMNGLGSKAYWDQFEESPELVVMYLPGETFFSAAIENDPGLIEDGSLRKVILATPTTLIALLKAVAYGWQQEQVATGAREINRLGREIYERFSVVADHIGRAGTNLSKAVEAHNDAVRSIETRLMPSFRRFRDLGVSTSRELPEAMDEVRVTARETIAGTEPGEKT